MAADDFDLDAYLRNARGWYAYLNQGDVWFPNKRPRVRIADMDAAWRLNCTRFLERRAAGLVHRYTFGEVSSMSQPAYDEVIEDVNGDPVLSGQSFSESDLLGELAHEAIEVEQESRVADPIRWMRSTALYRALAAGLPDSSIALEALNERARHWSTCPARKSADAACRCDEIRAAHREVSA